ncbi:MAG: class I SAM-dependent methyltransferase [Candidatus Peregrinibacteria bacterium]|nr:class I SAM-dependent methyltransferase [Candidatus Peregrinibacteria bacterium]
METPKDFMPGAHYHFLTPLYEMITRPLLRNIWERSAREVVQRAPEHGKIVDIGCGPGTVLRLIRMQRQDLSLQGFDIDPRMVEMARRKSADLNIAFEQASADQLPVADGSVDLAMSTMVFHHLPLEVKRRAIEEVKRILKPGSEFLLCDFSRSQQRGGMFFELTKRLRFALLTTLEPEVKPQLEGQLFDLAEEQGATIGTLWPKGMFISMHSIRFPLILKNL